MKMIERWLIECLRNAPLLLGFLCAARLRTLPGEWWIAALAGGVGAGVLIAHFTEARLHDEAYTPTWKGTLLTLVMYLVLAAALVLYLSGDARWSNWRVDLLFGVLIGVMLVLIQVFTWKGKKLPLLLKGLVMALAFPLLLTAFRLALGVQAWGWFLAVIALETLAISALTVMVYYGGGKKEGEG